MSERDSPLLTDGSFAAAQQCIHTQQTNTDLIMGSLNKQRPDLRQRIIHNAGRGKPYSRYGVVHETQRRMSYRFNFADFLLFCHNVLLSW